MAAAELGMSIRAYAKHRHDLGLRGGTATAVQRALSSGRIPRNKHGKIDPSRADLAWEENTDATRGGGREEPGGGAAPAAAGPTRVPDYKESRAIRESYAARTAKIEYDKLSESKVDVTLVQAEAFRLAHNVRDAIQSVPARLSAIFAAETDAQKIEALMTEELRAALEMLAGAET